MRKSSSILINFACLLPRYKTALVIMRLLIMGVVLLIPLAKAVSADSTQCEIINKPIDCSRLTHQECQVAKQAQHQRNLNIKQYCLVQAAQSGGGGGAGGSGGGSAGGNGAGSGSAGEGQADAETSSADTAGTSVEGVENEIEAEQNSPFSSKNPITTRKTGSSPGGSGPEWKVGALCDRFKAAYDAAKDESTKQQILEQSKQYNC